MRGRHLIVTGDDFGLALPVNEAIEIAHRDGILSAASLMVGASEAEDAVRRARRLPGLAVGLHLTLVNGRPVLPAERVPALVGTDGRFSSDLVRAGINFFFRPSARRQMALEIRAQFEAFRATGLALDHVNAHCHMHMHPTVLGLVLAIGRDFGLKALRMPYEPAAPTAPLAGMPLRAWVRLLKPRLARRGIKSNDAVLGLSDTGAMAEAQVLALLERLPDGVCEMYFHPATRRTPELLRDNPGYAYEGELEALTSPRVKAALAQRGLTPIAFRDLGA
ncbi:MAG: hopanoid biosynthesis-associated protein HpnK [Proteobacteria bacterium]|nr:hopanoid biosynthesis-associated protein HpnK [Pseudomonadota bacterium]MBI3499082.1 hopanoid biosynthesis-associated protein HpnK [Pseudomonadota bacterium]